MSIRAARLTPEGFARFGAVVVADGAGRGRSVNQGRARRIPGIDDLSLAGKGESGLIKVAWRERPIHAR